MTECVREQGFTLVEVLVALLILALASGAAFQAISENLSTLSYDQAERDAIMLAESKLAQTGHVIVLQPGHMTGRDGALSWIVNIGTQLDDPPPTSGLAAYPVHVSVQWRDDRGTETLSLASVRLGAPQPVTP